MAFWSQKEAYVLNDEDDDSSDVSSSSEDEINIILHGTPDQKQKLKRLQKKHMQVKGQSRERDESSSSEDEFEKEMNAELDLQVNYLEKSRDVSETQRQPMEAESAQSSVSNKPEEEFYDDIYFDSDEGEDDDGAGNGDSGNANRSQASGKHAVISNDDLLYDPTMDDKDQRWVDRQRRRNNNTALGRLTSSQNKQKPSKLPTSDALLDCPACMTTLCLDCQRHETYKHQYRAMFVMNCQVDNTQMLQCPEMPMKGKKKRKNQESVSSPNGPVSSDEFHPVKCTECNTVVGVVDSDEVYHFFNILASHT